MGFLRLSLLALAGVCLATGPRLCAQTAGEREIERAQTRVEELRKLYDAGAVARVKLEQAESELADAQDSMVLQRTLYSSDLTEGQVDEMLAVTERRLERRQKELDHARQLVEMGAASRLSLSSPLEFLDLARRERDLAQSRGKLVREIAEMARAEQAVMASATGPNDLSNTLLIDRFDEGGVLTPGELARLESAFEAKFSKPLPVSARGETALHRALGFDHRNRVDVAVHPDEAEGVWLRKYLVDANIAFFAFRHAVPGKATGAHIHVGPQSARVARVASGG